MPPPYKKAIRNEGQHYVKYVKKLRVAASTALLFTVCMLAPEKFAAEVVDYTGGVKNENSYEEYVFITGQPIKFTGSNKDVTVTVKEDDTKLTETYKLTLYGPKGEKLTRNFSYVSNVTNHEGVGQKTFVGDVTKFTEKITVGDITYTLDDYQLSKSTVKDVRPASDYYTGNANIRKTYTYSEGKGRNNTEKTILVEMDSRAEGYENFWGASETQIVEQTITFGDGKVGSVKTNVSSRKSRTTNYEKNNATLSSFEGGYMLVSASNMLSSASYQLPKATGTVGLDKEYMSRIERLIIPKFRDLSSSWAKGNIEKLYSLGIFEDTSNIFSPNTPMQRYDFAVSVGKAIDLRVLEEKSKKKTTTTSVFKDVRKTTKDYDYLQAAYSKGVIFGTTPELFNPDGDLTRQQAAAILVRALGMETRAPDPSYATAYADDEKIDDYARDGVYIVTELGLMSGDGDQFKPKDKLTRAQAAAILDRFLEYLEADLKQSFSDDILFLN